MTHSRAFFGSLLPVVTISVSVAFLVATWKAALLLARESSSVILLHLGLATYRFELNRFLVLGVGISACWIVAVLVWRWLVAPLARLRLEIAESPQPARVGLLCGMLFLGVGWAVNHYGLPHKFHPVSLLFDVVLAGFIVLVGASFLSARGRRTLRAGVSAVCRGSVAVFRWIAATAAVACIALNAYGMLRVPRGPNLLVIVVDCLRYDHLGCAGYHRDTSPNIDRCAEAGVLFQNAFSHAPWTKPAVASLFTSRHPVTHGAVALNHALSAREITLAEILRSRGYATLFLNGGNVHISRELNFDQGFERYHDEPTLSGAALTDRFLELLPRFRSRRFAAYLHFMDLHLPLPLNRQTFRYVKNPAGHYFHPWRTIVEDVRTLDRLEMLSQDERQHLVDMYDGQIRFVDDNIGRIVETLERKKLLENTLIVLTADHGEEFWDHGGYEHGHTLYNELIHVPLIVMGPGVEAGRRQERVGLVDVLPSVLPCLYIDVEGLPFEGRDVLEVPSAVEQEGPGEVFCSATLYGNDKLCVLRGEHKLVWNCSVPAGTGAESAAEPESLELYALSVDPGETNNLAATEEQAVTQLKKAIAVSLGRSKNRTAAETVDLNDEMKKRLRSLGYVR